MSRRTLIAANWKMHHLRDDARAFCRALTAAGEPPVETVIFPGFTLLTTLEQELSASPVAWGGQDVHPEGAGAHTGDVSAAQLVDVGCTWVLAGHSERRRDHGEGDELVAAKVAAAVRHGLRVMFCLGETQEQRAAGDTLAVLDRQLDAALGELPEQVDRFAVAYEPVWAIGTGDTATPDTAQEAHRHLRRSVASRRGDAAAGALRILYGGSVKPHNAAELIARPDLDGFLVGGASLDPESFLGIIEACV